MMLLRIKTTACKKNRSPLSAVSRTFFAALLGGCLVFLSSALYAQTALEQLNHFVTNTRSARGEFTQTLIKKDAVASSKNKLSSGTFSFSRPGKFRWAYTQPYQQLLVANGEKLWIYDPDLNQVIIKKLGTALGESPAAILFGNNQLTENFTLKNMAKRDGLEWLDARPKNKDSAFEYVSIGLRNGLPEVMELHDGFGQTSVLKFQNWVRNPPLNTSEFQFTPPRDADVFEQ